MAWQGLAEIYRAYRDFRAALNRCEMYVESFLTRKCVIILLSYQWVLSQESSATLDPRNVRTRYVDIG